MRNVCTTILNAADNVTQTGSAINSNQLVSASFQFYFNGTSESAAGTVKIQASNDLLLGATYMGGTPTNWVDIPSQSASVTSGASALLTIPNMTYQWIRAVYTSSSGGTGNVICEMNALSI